ncbi:MAG: thioredoxin [Candidatus Eisenbacteria sp.]|nr:thioredoxin [Candidatus Eisenbacteria bacterium]
MNKSLRLAIALIIVVAFSAAVVLKESRRGSADNPASGSNRSPEATTPPLSGEVLTAPLPRLVDLGSKYCVPCKMMAPILDELGTEYRARFEVTVIDVREDRTAASLYGIRVIPTQIFYDAEGNELFRHEGFMSKEAILEQWESFGVPVGDEPPSVDSEDEDV